MIDTRLYVLAGYDGLSGEWPCGSMVDWSDGRLNHKFWAMIALLETLDTEDFSFCETTYEGSDAHAPGKTTPPQNGKLLHPSQIDQGNNPALGSGIFAQGLHSSRGRVLALINTKATGATVNVPGATGRRAKIIDSLVGNEEARESTLVSDTVELGPFAVTFVQF